MILLHQCVSRKRKQSLSSNKIMVEKGHQYRVQRRISSAFQQLVVAGAFLLENTCAPCVDSFITSWMGQQ
jgi:hypothetical protein